MTNRTSFRDIVSKPDPVIKTESILDKNIYDKISHSFENSYNLILYGNLKYFTDHTFINTKKLILIDVDDDFVINKLNRNTFPNVEEIHYFKSNIPCIDILYRFNIHMGTYNSKLCEWVFDYDYTNYQYFRFMHKINHISRIGDLRQYYIKTIGDSIYYVKINDNIKINLTLYYHYQNAWFKKNK